MGLRITEDAALLGLDLGFVQKKQLVSSSLPWTLSFLPEEIKLTLFQRKATFYFYSPYTLLLEIGFPDSPKGDMQNGDD